MPTLADNKGTMKAQLGFRVDRATATLPQTTDGAIFTISGGRVLVTALLGEVTTAIQNQANNTKLKSVPTVGSTVDLCAVASTANKEVGTLLTITGLFSDAIQLPNAGAVSGLKQQVMLPIGSIKLDCAASNTGSVKWSLWYVPLDDGAAVVAA